MKILNVLISIGNVFFSAFALMLVWNWVPAEIFDITKLNYAQAFALSIFAAVFRRPPSAFLIKAEADMEDIYQLGRSLTVTFTTGLVIFLAFIAQAFI